MARQWVVKQGRDLYGGMVAADPKGILCDMVWCGKVRVIQQAHHVVWCAKPCGMYGMECMIMWHGGMVCVIQQADGKRLISIVSTTTCPATAMQLQLLSINVLHIAGIATALNIAQNKVVWTKCTFWIRS